jgi:YbbR domain-containing protein
MEEKALLEAIRSIVREEVEQSQFEMRADISDLKQGQLEMRADISDLKQGQSEMRANIKKLQTDVRSVKKDVRYTASVLEKTLHLYDELDQKWKAM